MAPRVPAVATAALGAALLAACGGGSSSTTQSTAGGSSASSASGILASAQAELQQAYAGTDRQLPSSGPKPAAGKNVVIVTCAMAAEGCAIAAKAEAKAAGLLGWRSTIVDGKFDPSNFVGGVRQAIASKADGVILNAIDCPTVKSAVQQATAAGIKVLGVNSLDCDDPILGQPGSKVFSAQLSFGGGSIADYYKGVGRTIADYLVVKTGGKAKVVEMHEDDVAGLKYVAQGLDARLAECSDCTLYRTAFLGPDLGNGQLQAKTAAALVAHPDANAVTAPYDAAALIGIGPAVKASGRPLVLTGNEGLTAAIAQIKAGGPLTMVPGYPSEWSGWAAVDDMNRLFAGQPAVDQGFGLQVVDKDHMLPSTYTFYDGNPKSDYKANFRKIWGVG